MDSIRSLVLLLACLVSVPVLPQVYRWEDPDGQVGYGDHPPADAGSVRRLTIDPSPVPTPAARPAGRARKARRGGRMGRRAPDRTQLQVLANDGRIAVGMPGSLVRQAWGEPQEVTRRASRSGTTSVWSYLRNGRKVRVRFDAEGRVGSVSW